MRAIEFLVEYIAPERWLEVGQHLTVGLTKHYFDRLRDKGIDRTLDRGKYSVMTHDEVKPSIEKLATSPGMLKKMRRVSVGDQYYVVDHSNHVVLGMRRLMDHRGKMKHIIGTVLTRLDDGSTPRIHKDKEAVPVFSMP